MFRHIRTWLTSRTAPLLCAALLCVVSAGCQSRSAPTATHFVSVNTMNPRVYVTLSPHPTSTRTSTPTAVPTIPHLPTALPSLTPTATLSPTFAPVSDVLPEFYQSLDTQSVI